MYFCGLRHFKLSEFHYSDVTEVEGSPPQVTAKHYYYLSFLLFKITPVRAKEGFALSTIKKKKRKSTLDNKYMTRASVSLYSLYSELTAEKKNDGEIM